MATAYALFPVLHNGKLHTFNDAIEGTEEEIKKLVAAGAAALESAKFMTEAQHEAHTLSASLSELFEKKLQEADSARAAGIAAEARHEAEVAAAKADAATAAAQATTAPAVVEAAAAAPVAAEAPAAPAPTTKVEVK